MHLFLEGSTTSSKKSSPTSNTEPLWAFASLPTSRGTLENILEQGSQTLFGAGECLHQPRFLFANVCKHCSQTMLGWCKCTLIYISWNTAVMTKKTEHIFKAPIGKNSRECPNLLPTWMSIKTKKKKNTVPTICDPITSRLPIPPLFIQSLFVNILLFWRIIIKPDVKHFILLYFAWLVTRKLLVLFYCIL